MKKLSDEALPWTWRAWVVAAVFGGVLFIAKADTYWNNWETRMKFLFMALAGVNMLVFQFGANRSVATWDRALPPPPAVRVAGAVSLACWIMVVVYGRWIGFTT